MPSKPYRVVARRGPGPSWLAFALLLADATFGVGTAFASDQRCPERERGDGDAVSYGRQALDQLQRGNTNEGECLLRHAAEVGGRQEVFNLGMYLREHSSEEGLLHLRKAAALGFGPAWAEVARSTVRRSDSAEGRRLAFEEFARAADAGERFAALDLVNLALTENDEALMVRALIAALVARDQSAPSSKMNTMVAEAMRRLEVVMPESDVRRARARAVELLSLPAAQQPDGQPQDEGWVGD